MSCPALLCLMIKCMKSTRRIPLSKEIERADILFLI